jgi:hypothetical protein
MVLAVPALTTNAFPPKRVRAPISAAQRSAPKDNGFAYCVRKPAKGLSPCKLIHGVDDHGANTFFKLFFA